MAASGRSNGHDLGPESFVHLDVVSAFSRLQSPATPRDYVSALTQQFPLNERTASDARPALAICDWGLQSAVKTAVAPASTTWWVCASGWCQRRHGIRGPR